ncbi:DoxX family protein [Gordonia liuliyuniae]|uniref:DoxX family protein n=1 Tax=Gordonia liuliyuniae TaxID=2911517 RepID=A0ABS9IVQ3_9ACTN|nr:DoxX family protein [Gordonia liuliyuniae]MCF8589642.1 DoxX family protein [Gordonia liuliyuniae]
MADESEPESKPITVSELIARSENDEAFPRSESMSVRRAGRDDEQANTTTSSGMPAYRTAKQADADATRPPRVVGASGMPSYSPTTDPEPEPEANAVTGIIPVVSDDPDADTGTLRAVRDDDFIDDDLPPMEYRSVAADTTSTMQVRTDDGPSPFEQTASIPVVSGTNTSQAGVSETAALTDSDGGPEPDTRTDPDSDADLDLDADIESDDDEPEPTGWAARRAARAERKAERKTAGRKTAGRKAEDAKAAVATSDAADTDTSAATADEETRAADEAEPSPVLGWLAFAGELVLGLAVGAGLFWGFTELWKSYVYLALVLAVVVIFAVVTFAHVLRKRDLPTTLLALGVGMVVTIGPLVLLAAQP